MTLCELTDVPHEFLLERLLEMLSQSFYFCDQALREQKTA